MNRDRRILEALVSARALLRAEGNPYHDPANGQFTGAGGSTGRRERRRRRLRRLKRRILREHAALKARHKAERQQAREKHRERIASHKAYYGRRKASLDRQHARELARMDREHGREIAVMERRRERERAQEARDKARGKVTDEQIAGWEAQHAADVASEKESQGRIRASRQEWHDAEHNLLKDERREAAKELKDRHARERKRTVRRQREERAEFREGAREEWAEAGGKLKQKGASRALGGLRGGAPDRGQSGLDRGDVGPVAARRLSPGRTHKASSAEAILRHALRSLGLSGPYRRGELTGLQALEVLEAIRQYARGWLHHEAEALIRHYGRAVDVAAGRSGGLDDPVCLARIAAGHGHPDPGLVGELSGLEVRGLSSAMRHHVGRFFGRARQFVREAILAGTMALSGPGEITSDDLDEVDRQAAEQVAYLERFEADVQARPPVEIAEPSGVALAEPMTAAQFSARAEQYGNAVWAVQNWDRQKAIRSGKAVRERRYHLKPSPDVHACNGCLVESDKAWQPIGSLRPIGDCECKQSCDCYFAFEQADGSVYITSRGWAA